MAELDMPAVLIAPSCDDHPTGVCVCVDDRPGIRAVVEHLLQLGHTRIAHVTGPAEFVHSASRVDAWAGALHDAGLPLGPLERADFSARGGADATTRLLDLPEPPSAIVFANDLMAIAGSAVAAGRGVDVPGDLSIAGFDDTEVAAHLRPALTTVRSDAFAWGRAAGVRLTDLVAGNDATKIELPSPQLVIRDSTAAPRPTGPRPRNRSEH